MLKIGNLKHIDIHIFYVLPVGEVKPMCLICNGTVHGSRSGIIQREEELQNNAHGTIWRDAARVCSRKRKGSGAANRLWLTNRQGTEIPYPTIDLIADRLQQRFSLFQSIASVIDLVNSLLINKRHGTCKLQRWRVFRSGVSSCSYVIYVRRLR